MGEQQKHEMMLDRTHLSGAEEWSCPNCERRLLISWEPKFKKIVLEAGDELSIHRGGKGGLIVGTTQIAPANYSDSKGKSGLNDDAGLAPWEAWMEESDFENLWGDEGQES